MNLRFTDPLSSGVLDCEGVPSMTADAAVRDLIDAGFLPAKIQGSEYALVNARTKRAILARQTFADAGVRDGDVIEVIQANQGASPWRR